MNKVIAVDFDGTLVKHAFPEIGETNYRVVAWVKKRQKLGDRIILCTCRDGKELQEAVDHCEFLNIKLDAVNENIPELMNRGFAKRKVCADIYLDDKAMNVDELA